MRKVSIELPDVITVNRGGGSVDVPTKTFDADMIVRLFGHGIVQKVGDAASNASSVAAETNTPVAEVANGKMMAVVDSLVKNEWGTTRSASGVDERTRVARSVVHAAVKAKFGAKSPEWKTFNGLSDADKAAKLDGWFAANEAAFTPAVDAEMERRAAKRADKSSLTGAISIEL